MSQFTSRWVFCSRITELWSVQHFPRMIEFANNGSSVYNISFDSLHMASYFKDCSMNWAISARKFAMGREFDYPNPLGIKFQYIAETLYFWMHKFNFNNYRYLSFIPYTVRAFMKYDNTLFLLRKTDEIYYSGLLSMLNSTNQ